MKNEMIKKMVATLVLAGTIIAGGVAVKEISIEVARGGVHTPVREGMQARGGVHAPRNLDKQFARGGVHTPRNVEKTVQV